MTSAEMLKAARLLKTLAKPLWSAGQTVARNAGDMMKDLRPGTLTPRLDGFASRMGQRVADADAHRAGMGFMGRQATRAGQFVTGTAPVVGAMSVLPATVTPLWNTLQNVGHAAGQGGRWALDPTGTAQHVREGGRDAMVGIYSGLNSAPYADRQAMINQVGQGQGVGMENLAYAQQNGNPWGFRQGLSQIGLNGQGDMRGWLMQRAQQRREQERIAQGYAKSGMAKEALSFKAVRGGVSSLWNAVRGGRPRPPAPATYNGTPVIPRAAPPQAMPPQGPRASSQTINIPGAQPPPALPSGAPAPGLSGGQFARKWLGRGAKSLAYAAPLPLVTGAVDGWFGANDAARGVGGDIAMNEFQNKIQQQGWFGQHALGLDPSLMLTPELYQSVPDFQKAYEQQTGQKLEYGPLARVRNGWNNPSFLASDSTGSYNVPAPLPFNQPT